MRGRGWIREEEMRREEEFRRLEEDEDETKQRKKKSKAYAPFFSSLFFPKRVDFFYQPNINPFS